MGKETKQVKIYFETYGCQMNFNDTEIAGGILKDKSYTVTGNIDEADVVILNTCAVRDNAEQKIHHRLDALKYNRKKNSKLLVGVIGCMAERIGDKLVGEKLGADFAAGPDSYRKLPELIEEAARKNNIFDLELSLTETYNDIIAHRDESISGWLSIMRGCNNFCTYCIVPYTRGRERSKPFADVMEEAHRLIDNEGVKELTLLGQNVNSYNDTDSGKRFPELLTAIAETFPKTRIRFVTSHPYDLSDAMIEAMAKFDNICNYLHLPVQAASDKILKAMNRKYDIAHYKKLISKVRKAVPEMAISTDIISGFPGETEEDHKKMLDLLAEIRYDSAFMFNYSTRPGTKAAERLEDDVPTETKKRRLNEIIALQNTISKEKNEDEIGKIHEIMVESESKKNANQWQGRSGTNKVIIFDNDERKYSTGDLLKLKVVRATSATLFGEIV
jgi:tRNA-2-methylthio-N6-dimethylallyladenosine synthase